MAGEWIIQLPWKKPPLSLNDRYPHPAVQWRLTRQVRQVGKAKAIAKRIPKMQKCSVELVWFVNTRHRRDVDNPMPTMKALCDGLVDAGIVADDTPEYMVKKIPRIAYDKTNTPGIGLIVKEVAR